MHNCQSKYKYDNSVIVRSICDSLVDRTLACSGRGREFAPRWRQKVFCCVGTCVTQDLCCHFQDLYLCQINTNVCLSYMTKVLCSGEHKLVCGQHKCFQSDVPQLLVRFSAITQLIMNFMNHEHYQLASTYYSNCDSYVILSYTLRYLCCLEYNKFVTYERQIFC